MNKLLIVLISVLSFVSCAQNPRVTERTRINAVTVETSEPGIKNLGDDWIESTAQIQITNITPEKALE